MLFRSVVGTGLDRRQAPAVRTVHQLHHGAGALWAQRDLDGHTTGIFIPLIITIIIINNESSSPTSSSSLYFDLWAPHPLSLCTPMSLFSSLFFMALLCAGLLTFLSISPFPLPHHPGPCSGDTGPGDFVPKECVELRLSRDY